MKMVMIVEDSPAMAGALKENIVKAGYDVHVVHNGFEALRDLDSIQPDLVISDINMPKLDGLKLIQGIRNRLETRDIPFILLSSQFDPRTLETGKKLGARFFIAKPFKMEYVIECVKKAL